jgi:hypothetical protein
VHLELHVVPRRRGTVAIVERDRLRIAAVARVVVTPVTQVDPAREREVVVGVRPVEHDELLVVASAPSDALVEHDFATGRVDDLGDLGVALLREVGLTRMGSPE